MVTTRPGADYVAPGQNQILSIFYLLLDMPDQFSLNLQADQTSRLFLLAGELS
jgi:hypothetical protein